VSCLQGHRLLYLHGVENLSSTRVGGSASCRELLLRAWAHTLVGAEFVVRGRDFSCEAEICHARQRLLVRGGDLSCEAETYRVGRRLLVEVPLVGNWSEMQPTGRRPDVLPV
jgi:hypothetical protein